MEFIQQFCNNKVYTEEPLKKIERDLWSMLLRNKDKPFMSSTGDENITTFFFIIQPIVVNKKWGNKPISKASCQACTCN